MTDSVTSTPAQTSAIAEITEITNLTADAVARLRQLTQISIQSIWHYSSGDLPVAVATQAATWQNWAIAATNARDHIAWGKGKQVLWLGQRVVIPAALQHYPLRGLTLRIALMWWAEQAQIFVNGTLVQEGDLFDCSTRIVLSADAQAGEAIDVALRLVSPGHDDGALVLSRCIYEQLLPQSIPEPGFVADELAVVQHYLTTHSKTLEPDALETLKEAVCSIDWDSVGDRPTFDHSLAAVRQTLAPLGEWVKQRSLHLLGHAHLDLAWLWDVADTWDAAERTFKSVLHLQQDFPELIFCHSTPALYHWVEQHRPDLFAAIQRQVALKRWEVVAGLWVEPELNTVSGESIARQILYGQRYVQDKFGEISAIAWLPDSFGFCWQLPQLLTQGGIRYFVTQKLRWNDTNEFPYELFWWRSPDGSKILSYSSPRIGEGIDPVKMADYACTWESKTTIPDALWLPGVGDHGGGPTRDMLETARRWQRSPLFPNLRFSSALDYLESITHSKSSSAPLPTWNDELYLEFHRGCYTTHADQKRWNRQCETLLYQAELFASLATLTVNADYPKAELETAWKQVLFNQFHDILPGSSIPQVFVDANQTWEAAAQTAQQTLETALEAIASHITLPSSPHPGSYPVIIFNSLSWMRSEVAAIPLPHPPSSGQAWQIHSASGQLLPSQVHLDNAGLAHLLIRATEVPGVGYQLFWLSQVAVTELHASALELVNTSEPSSTKTAPEWILENEFLRVLIDPNTGDLSRVFDKTGQRDVLSAPGNQLQAFQDGGQYWDAWNIDPDYAQHPLPAPVLKSVEWVEKGAIATRLRIIRQLGQSYFYQDYVLEAGSPLLKIITTVDWQERQVMVKAAFPVNVTSTQATYEIPFGAIQRPSQPTTPQEKAKWEVPALHWADLSEPEYGVSLLNDCKYGYDSQPSQLRLTLLRSPSWPDPNADRGQHQFTYALYPHQHDWKAAHTVRRGYELNQPLLIVVRDPASSDRATLPAKTQFLNLGTENLVLTAFKPSEDNANTWLLRCYECWGDAAKLDFTGDRGLVFTHLHPKTVQQVNLLEQPISNQPQLDQTVSISPWAIASFIAERCVF